MKIKIPKPEEMSGERYFEIRDVGSDGCGSFMTFCVDEKTTDEEIGNIAASEWTEIMTKKEQMNELRRGFFWQPIKWRSRIKVVEMLRKIKTLTEPNRQGRMYQNEWSTKRKGLKFVIENSWIRMTMSDGTVRSANGYIPLLTKLTPPR